MVKNGNSNFLAKFGHSLMGCYKNDVGESRGQVQVFSAPWTKSAKISKFGQNRPNNQISPKKQKIWKWPKIALKIYVFEVGPTSCQKYVFLVICG